MQQLHGWVEAAKMVREHAELRGLVYGYFVYVTHHLLCVDC